MSFGLDCNGGAACQDEMHGGGHGEHRFVLETGVQRFGGTPEDCFGQSGAGEGAEGKEDGSERQPVAGKLVAAWISAGQFHPAARYP